MADLRTTYMGLQLRNPVVASASPLNRDLGSLRALEDHGIAAVVLPSLFEEDISRERDAMELLLDAGAGVVEVGGSYLPQVSAGGEIEHYLSLIGRARSALDIPVIASLNGTSDAGWIDLARLLEEAGASAIELNIYEIPLGLDRSARDIEERVLSIVRRVRATTRLPLAVKLNPYYSAFAQMASTLQRAGADALVLFNRLYHPDLDLVRLAPIHDLHLSRRHEMRLPMMWLATLHGRISLSLAASTGVESADDVLRYLLAGADAVMSTSALLRHGLGYAASLVAGIGEWLDARDFDSVATIRGLLARRDEPARGTWDREERDAYRAELAFFQAARLGRT